VIGWVPTRYSKSLLWRILKYLFAIILHVFQNNSKSFRPGIIEDQKMCFSQAKFISLGDIIEACGPSNHIKVKTGFSDVAKIINAKITCEISTLNCFEWTFFCINLSSYIYNFNKKNFKKAFKQFLISKVDSIFSALFCIQARNYVADEWRFVPNLDEIFRQITIFYMKKNRKHENTHKMKVQDKRMFNKKVNLNVINFL
jgi:hypothetical protein